MKALVSMTAVLLFLLQGCVFNPFRNDAATIASLDKKPVHIEDTPVEPGESRAMIAYRDFLDNDSESKERPQAMRRLADLGLEADGALPGKTVDAIEASIQLYRDVLVLYPDRKDNDAVLYQLARAYEHSNQPETSLATLKQLIASYPRSRYILEAHFRSGEIQFVEKRYRQAGLSYRQVVAAGDSSPFLRQSLYKLGWCDFKQGLYPEGIDSFMALLDRVFQDAASGEQQLKGLSRADRELVDDTLRVISLSLSYEAGPKSLADYFSKHGPRLYEDLVYDRLGSLYLSRERYSDAAQAFQVFVENNPEHKQAPWFQIRVIETYRKGNFPTLVLAGKQQFVERYNTKGDYWKRYDPKDSREIIDYLKVSLTELSRHYHALAQRSHKDEDYQQAIHWYRSYLDSFADSPEAPGVNFLLAETLFESGNTLLATREYENTAYKHGTHDKAADAGYAAVLAYIKQEKNLQGDARQQWHQASIENALRFSSHFTQHPQALAVRTRASENLLAGGEHERAARVAQDITDHQAATAEQKRIAWTVQAHAWFELHQYRQAERGYQQVLVAMPADSENNNDIIEKLAASIYKQGEAAQQAGDAQAAVLHFQRVGQLTPAASIAATAEYDAAATLMSLQQWTAAARQLQHFRDNYPDDARQPEVTRRLASAWLAADKPQQAAAEFERIGREGSDPKLRREALWQAAELYATASQPRQSISSYQFYIKQFPHPSEDAIEAGYRISELYKADGQAQAREKWLSFVIDTDRKAGKERTERTRYLAANATFSMSEAVYRKYSVARLTLPLDKSLAVKKRLMEKCLAMYEQAAAYKVADVTTAATYRSADVYLQMGTSLMESQRPVELSGEALEQYNFLLEDQAWPFEEQGIALHKTNLEHIRSGTWNPWVEKSLQQLSSLVPAHYAKLERSTPYVETLH